MKKQIFLILLSMLITAQIYGDDYHYAVYYTPSAENTGINAYIYVMDETATSPPADLNTYKPVKDDSKDGDIRVPNYFITPDHAVLLMNIQGIVYVDQGGFDDAHSCICADQTKACCYAESKSVLASGYVYNRFDVNYWYTGNGNQSSIYRVGQSDADEKRFGTGYWHIYFRPYSNDTLIISQGHDDFIYKNTYTKSIYYSIDNNTRTPLAPNETIDIWKQIEAPLISVADNTHTISIYKDNTSPASYTLEVNRRISQPDPKLWTGYQDFKNHIFYVKTDATVAPLINYTITNSQGTSPGVEIDPNTNVNIDYNDNVTANIYSYKYNLDTTYNLLNYTGNNHTVDINNVPYTVAPGQSISIEKSNDKDITAFKQYNDSITIDGDKIDISRSNNEFDMSSTILNPTSKYQIQVLEGSDIIVPQQQISQGHTVKGNISNDSDNVSINLSIY